MKIDPQLTTANSSTSAGRVAQGQQVEGARQASTNGVTAGRGTDQMILSQQARDVLVAQKAMAQTPEVRQEKVAQLRQQIADGTFKIDAARIADRIVEGGV